MAASRSFYSVRYIRLPDLLVEISVARANGTYRDYMKKLRKEKLLILDEWLLYPLKEAEARDVLELVEARNKVASTVSVPSMTPASGMKTCTTRPWLMPSVTESSTMPIPSRSRASPCESARASPSDLPHGGLVHHAPGRHAPSLRKECTIPAVAMHHHPRSSCTFGAAYALIGFSSECLYSFHYSDNRGYLIFCCHGVATDVRKHCGLKSSEDDLFRYSSYHLVIKSTDR